MSTVATAGVVWALATPLFTGPDEVSQARRAAAVVRGELTGRQERPGPALLLTVDVPALYGDPAEQNWLCHLGPLVPGTPQEPMALPAPACPDLRAPPTGTGLVEAETVQYRGQPLFYAVVGLPTLVSDGIAGAYGMRLVTVLLTAALVASAASSMAGSHRRRLAGLGLLACLTPGVLYLAAATNPSAVEVAAALSAWAAIGSLASHPAGADAGRLVARLGAALVVLALCRGLGPGFAAAVVLAGTFATGRRRCRELLRRADVRGWSIAVVVATALSLAWLVHIGSEYPLPERAGSGAADALGWLPWYLRQSVGVFGTNDSAVSPLATGAWCLVASAVFAVGAVGLFRSGAPAARRQATAACLALAGGLALNVTAEGLSLPPIGFFWQGRYALPLLLGGIVLAVVGAAPSTGAGAAALPDPPLAMPASIVAAAVLVAIHGHGLWVVTGHLSSPTGALRGATLLVYVAVMAGLASVLTFRPHQGELP